MEENKIIIITMILNFIVAIIKLTAGIIFSFSTLISDSVQSFMDFITDITSLIANKIGKRRANKIYPFGYGQVYYVANLFTGALLFLIGIFIVYQFFFFKGKFEPNIKLLWILCGVLFLKYIVVYLLEKHGKDYKSELMIEASKESRADLISTIVVIGIIIVSFFEQYIPKFINVDKIGCLGMAIYVFYISIKMTMCNIKGILISDTENNEIKEEVKKELEKFEMFQFGKIRIIKMSSYYSVFLQVKVKKNLTIKEYLENEKKVKLRLKKIDKTIRFVDIEPIQLD